MADAPNPLPVPPTDNAPEVELIEVRGAHGALEPPSSRYKPGGIRGPRSAVWNYFYLDHGRVGEAFCEICANGDPRAAMKYHSSTKALRDHLKRHHPAEHTQLEMSAAGKGGGRVSHVPNQQTLKVFDPLPVAEQKKLNTHLAKCLAIDLQPPHTVERDGFRSFCAMLADVSAEHPKSRYTVPCSSTIRNEDDANVLEMNAKTVALVQKCVIGNKASGSTLECDMWEDGKKRHWLAQILHFTDITAGKKYMLLLNLCLHPDKTAAGQAQTVRSTWKDLFGVAFSKLDCPLILRQYGLSREYR
jgi:hypothetical protein